jgi:hypothetical protein
LTWSGCLLQLLKNVSLSWATLVPPEGGINTCGGTVKDLVNYAIFNKISKFSYAWKS